MSDTNEKQVKPLTMGDILSGNCDENSEEVREVKRLMKETAQKISETFPAAIKAMTESFREFFRVENMKSLQAKLLLMKFRLDPSCVDSRRGKKRDCLSEYHVMLRAHALDAFHFNQSGHIKYFIDMALATQDPEVFRILAQVAEELRAPSNTLSARRVQFALEAEIRLIEKLGRIPTKQEIRLESGMDLEQVRWTEIHNAAHQSKNPTGKPKRGQERHGDNRLKKPPKK
jgi:hypothetical protein